MPSFKDQPCRDKEHTHAQFRKDSLLLYLIDLLVEACKIGVLGVVGFQIPHSLILNTN